MLTDTEIIEYGVDKVENVTGEYPDTTLCICLKLSYDYGDSIFLTKDDLSNLILLMEEEE